MLSTYPTVYVAMATDDQSEFLWFVSILVVIASISINIVWKVMLKCIYRFVSNECNENDENTMAIQINRKASKNTATQTVGHYDCNGVIYVTKCGERWHREQCGHLVGRTSKQLTPCNDCNHG